jgi:hypothetical protein
LTRDFIHQVLYAPGSGYFTRDIIQTSDKGVGERDIDFNSLWGQWEYEQTVAKLYAEKPEAWMTPVEIFAPYYSEAIARYILSEVRKKSKQSNGDASRVELYEMGGGSGTNAEAILNYIRRHSPRVYESMSYTLLEISAPLAKTQRERLSAHKEVVQVLNTDVLDWAYDIRVAATAGQRARDQHAVDTGCCFVIGMEVLDNMPHDKVVLDQKAGELSSKEGGDNEWLQTAVQTGEGGFTEVYEQVCDPLIQRTLKLFPPFGTPENNSTGSEESSEESSGGITSWLSEGMKAGGAQSRRHSGYDSAFIPTALVRLLDGLHSKLPHHRLILADFSELPAGEAGTGPSLQALNAPLVSGPTVCADGEAATAAGWSEYLTFGGKGSGSAGVADRDTYLVPVGDADIFFATDFHALHSAHTAITGREAAILSTAEFVDRFGEPEHTSCMSGYNPMREVFSNQSFFLS